MTEQDTVDRVAAFHGHMCPGLALGIRAAQIARERIGDRAIDEEVVAIVETDMCAVDAIQFLTGATFGKGNLVHLDYGKNAYTFLRRSDGKAIRIVSRPDPLGPPNTEWEGLFTRVRSGQASAAEHERFQQLHLARSRQVLDAPAEQLYEVCEVEIEPPAMARIHTSVRCRGCNEPTMETRIRRLHGEELCIPCFSARESADRVGAPGDAG